MEIRDFFRLESPTGKWTKLVIDELLILLPLLRSRFTSTPTGHPNKGTLVKCPTSILEVPGSTSANARASLTQMNENIFKSNFHLNLATQRDKIKIINIF
jgi:hypothetical protein